MTKFANGACWSPTLPLSEEPLHVRLFTALQEDVASGVLEPGARLPTHRELAHRLKIGVGTVTRAYVEAEVRGLITAQVGRGSFIALATDARPANQPIDLARNLGPAEPAARRLREAMSRLGKRPDLIDHLTYAPPAGLDAHRRAGAAWLGRTAGLETGDWRRLLVCAGAQQAMSLTFGRLCRAGETILTEAGTFYGMRALAAHAGYRLLGVAMDRDGLDPDELDRAARTSGARVLYTSPTLQNPTGRSMPSGRREAIARIARAHDLWIVEDGVYQAFAASDVAAPLASFAPERTFYISGVSKILGPGLRTGYLIAPTVGDFDALAGAVRSLSYSPPAFGSLIATQWIDDGTADLIAREIRVEIEARRKIAAAAFGAQVELGGAGSPHIWLPLSELDAERLARRALLDGVEVTPPSAPVVDAALIAGVRLCLGAASDRSSLERALCRVAAALRETSLSGASGVV